MTKTIEVHYTVESAKEALWVNSFARVDSSIVRELKDVLDLTNGKYRYGKPSNPLAAFLKYCDVEALG